MLNVTYRKYRIWFVCQMNKIVHKRIVSKRLFESERVKNSSQIMAQMQTSYYLGICGTVLDLIEFQVHIQENPASG